MNKIKKFIEDNELDLSGYGSGVNSAFCILCGYALYIGFDDWDDLLDELEENDIIVDDYDELERVFNYAMNNGYGEWWSHPQAHGEYKFED